MLDFDRVTDIIPNRPSTRHLSNCTLHIPTGRYVLLGKDTYSRRAVVDLITGVRPPTTGKVRRLGRCSWAIGRSGFIRGKVNGHQVLRLITTLYRLDHELCEGFVLEAVSRPEVLDQSIERWDPVMRQEFGHTIALLPGFDIVVIDGVLPYGNGTFSRIWSILFDEKTAGKTVILSTTRASDVHKFCQRISHHLERAIAKFPPRPPIVDAGSAEDSFIIEDDI